MTILPFPVDMLINLVLPTMNTITSAIRIVDNYTYL